jgi:hypothetical protein
MIRVGDNWCRRMGTLWSRAKEEEAVLSVQQECVWEDDCLLVLPKVAWGVALVRAGLSAMLPGALLVHASVQSSPPRGGCQVRQGGLLLPGAVASFLSRNNSMILDSVCAFLYATQCWQQYPVR